MITLSVLCARIRSTICGRHCLSICYHKYTSELCIVNSAALHLYYGNKILTSDIKVQKCCSKIIKNRLHKFRLYIVTERHLPCISTAGDDKIKLEFKFATFTSIAPLSSCAMLVFLLCRNCFNKWWWNNRSYDCSLVANQYALRLVNAHMKAKCVVYH